MKRMLILVPLIALGGCSLFSRSGVADYEASVERGGVKYTLSIYNSKDIGNLDAGFKFPDGPEVWLRESEISASSPMAVQAQTTLEMMKYMQALLPYLPASPRTEIPTP